MSTRAATTIPPLMVLLSLVVMLAAPARASIHFLDSGKAFPSRPDPHFGQPLLRGYDYMGRIQTIPENPTLCDYNRKDKYNIVAPKDGIPGTLFSTYNSWMYKSIVCTRICLSHPFLFQSNQFYNQLFQQSLWWQKPENAPFRKSLGWLPHSSIPPIRWDTWLFSHHPAGATNHNWVTTAKHQEWR